MRRSRGSARRVAPRPLGIALERALHAARPATLLARLQAAWPAVAGPAMAAEATPVSEREGVVTIACSGAVWAQELELLGPDLLARLAAHEALAGVPAPARLRFVVRSEANVS